MRHRVLFLFAILVSASLALGQRPQTSPGVGNAVLLARNSIQIDRDSAVFSGDIIVNDPTAGPVLGEQALSLDRNVTTPPGYKLAATSIDLDQGAAVGGDVYFNTLTNQGSIAGARFTPLALPVFANLPPVSIRPPGSTDIVVPDGGLLTLPEGAYGNLTIGKAAKLRLNGGGYAFRSISVARGGALRCAAPADLVVSGRADFAANSVIAPDTGSGLTAASIRIQIDGINGSDGALLSTPPAVKIGQAATVSATLYATGGSLVFDQGVQATGAFLARDIAVGQGGRFTIQSAFDQPPTADPQSVATSGSAPLQITLTGSDPEGEALAFSIVSGPAAGTLSAPAAISPTSASVTYTPAAAGVADAFTFRVTDLGGATGDAIVTINAASSDPPFNPTTVLAADTSLDTTKNVPATLLLRGAAPAGVSLTFSILPNTGPSHGSIGAVTQGSETPQRTATVVYTPDAGYVGPDALQFQACGAVSNATVCDSALFSINVLDSLADAPSLAHDVTVSTFVDASVLISLGETSVQSAGRHLVIAPHALMQDPVEIAGNVADSNLDGLGDNVNPLPGPVPIFMSAGVQQSGGDGSNGTVRMQFEWDMSSIAGSASALQSAEVTLPTHRGTVDSLDTLFYWQGVSGDGTLSNSDFQAPAERIPGAVMPVPEAMPVGGEGTFSFSVLDQLLASARSGFRFFAIQGRVDESLGTSARGLEVRTTASENVSSNNVPMLTLATGGIAVPLLYRITWLPQSGRLKDSSNNAIEKVPYDLPSPQVNYTPNGGFVGLDSFSFAVSNGTTSATALANISVVVPNCFGEAAGCYNGR